MNEEQNSEGKLSAEEAESRLKAAIRGSCEVGHKPMKDVAKRKKKKKEKRD